MALLSVHFLYYSYSWIPLFTYLVGFSDWLFFQMNYSKLSELLYDNKVTVCEIKIKYASYYLASEEGSICTLL